VAIEYDGWYQYAVCQKHPEPRVAVSASLQNGSAA
jgi:hypothetical protein